MSRVGCHHTINMTLFLFNSFTDEEDEESIVTMGHNISY